MNPERDQILRFAVKRIKAIEPLRQPPYDLPADSFIIEAIEDVLAYMQNSEMTPIGERVKEKIDKTYLRVE